MYKIKRRFGLTLLLSSINAPHSYKQDVPDTISSNRSSNYQEKACPQYQRLKALYNKTPNNQSLYHEYKSLYHEYINSFTLYLGNTEEHNQKQAKEYLETYIDNDYPYNQNVPDATLHAMFQFAQDIHILVENTYISSDNLYHAISHLLTALKGKSTPPQEILPAETSPHIQKTIKDNLDSITKQIEYFLRKIQIHIDNQTNQSGRKRDRDDNALPETDKYFINKTLILNLKPTLQKETPEDLLTILKSLFKILDTLTQDLSEEQIKDLTALFNTNNTTNTLAHDKEHKSEYYLQNRTIKNLVFIIDKTTQLLALGKKDLETVRDFRNIIQNLLEKTQSQKLKNIIKTLTPSR